MGKDKLPSWLNREKPTRKRSDKQEKRLAKQMGGVQYAGSGSVFGENDVKTKDFSIEAKTTEKKQYTLKVDDIKKLRKKTPFDKRGLFVVEFSEYGEELVMMDISDFLELTGLDQLNK